jgi:hypothetical protein
LRIRIRFNLDQYPAFFVNADPDPVLMTKNWKKFTAEKFEFSSLLWVILALPYPVWIRIPNANPDPDPADQNECGSGIRADPDRNTAGMFLKIRKQMYFSF